MDLLEAMRELSKSSGGRRLARPKLYVAITRVTQRLTQLLRQGDVIELQGRKYFLVEESSGTRYLAVDVGRGSASLGVRFADTPFASYEEHVFFSDHATQIVEMFAEIARRDVKRMQNAEQKLLTMTERKL